MSITDKLLSVRPVTKADMDVLVPTAARDGHIVMFPTHVATLGSEIVGYASIIATPILNCWLSSKSLSPRHSLQLMATGEAIAAERGAKAVIVPCAAESPFAPMMERMGFTKLGSTVLHAKEL